jgi:hypothetical protein
LQKSQEPLKSVAFHLNLFPFLIVW